MWGGIAGVAAGAGPVAGGFLTGALGWRSVFLVNVPIGLAAIVLTMRHVASSSASTGGGFDWVGQATGFAALGAVAFAGIQAGDRGWTALPIIGAAVLAAIAGALFVGVERRAMAPMLPLGLLGDATFSAASIVGLLLNFGFYGQLFLMSLFFQTVRGDSALATGLALLPETGMAIVGSTLGGRVTSRTGPRLPMLIGLVVGALGLVGLTRVGATTPYLAIGPLLVAAGLGTSFTMPAMTAAVIESAPAERAGVASGVLNASRQVGGMLGVALLGAFVGGGRSFVPGLHVAGLLAGGAFFVGAALTGLAIRAKPRRARTAESGREAGRRRTARVEG